MLETAAKTEREAAQPPPAPTGFNNTQHNCNSSGTKPKRKPGRHCGHYTLIGEKDGKYKHHRFRCKSYACGICGPKKIRMVRKRIAQRAVEHKLQRFLTLTLDPKKLEPGCDLKAKIGYLSDAWRKMRVYLKRKLGKSLVFVAVMELQQNGNPHLHMLVGSWLGKDWISNAWQRAGGGKFTRIEAADVHRVSAYLAKYFTDESLCDLPAGTRRFWTSQGLALFERVKGEGGYVLVNLPIEYWRERSGGVKAEEYKTEEDGARSLVAFEAAEVSPVLVDRLSPGNTSVLWVEIRRKAKTA